MYELSQVINPRIPIIEIPFKPPWGPSPISEKQIQEIRSWDYICIWSTESVDKVNFDLIRKWEEGYEEDTAGVRCYRMLVTKVKCTTRVKQLRLSSLMKQEWRLVLSRACQYTTGHALIGAWLEKHNIIRFENLSNTCWRWDWLETIDRILRRCPLSGGRETILRKVDVPMRDHTLFGTKKGTQAVSEYIREGIPSRQWWITSITNWGSILPFSWLNWPRFSHWIFCCHSNCLAYIRVNLY